MKQHPLFPLVLALSLLVGCAPAQPVQTPAPPPSLSQPQTPQRQSPPFTLAYYPGYTLHPSLAENRANLSLAGLLYEGLFETDSSFQARPLLCQSHTVSEDGLTWTFTLRSGVTFSDGTPLTGALAAKSLNLSLTDPDSQYCGRIPQLRTVTAADQAVVISLTQPNYALPLLLDIPLVLETESGVLGTGSYVLGSQDDQPCLVLRTDWWQRKSLPFLTIPLFAIQQTDDLIAAFDSGEVTLLDADLTATNALGYSGSYEAWDYNTTDLIYLGFNTWKGYCKTPQVRQAISRGLDRESITTIPYARHAAASALSVHPDSTLYNQTLAEQASYSPEALVQALEAFPAPEQPLKLVVNSENNAKVATAEYVAYQLQTAGLSVEVEKLSWDSYLDTLERGNFDLYLAEVMLAADFDLSAIVSSDGPLNYSRWKDEQTDMLLETLRGTPMEQRASHANLFHSHLIQEMPIAPICFKHGSVLTQWGRLSGLAPEQHDIFHALEDWTLDD